MWAFEGGRTWCLIGGAEGGRGMGLLRVDCQLGPFLVVEELITVSLSHDFFVSLDFDDELSYLLSVRLENWSSRCSLLRTLSCHRQIRLVGYCRFLQLQLPRNLSLSKLQSQSRIVMFPGSGLFLTLFIDHLPLPFGEISL